MWRWPGQMCGNRRKEIREHKKTIKASVSTVRLSSIFFATFLYQYKKVGRINFLRALTKKPCIILLIHMAPKIPKSVPWIWKIVLDFSFSQPPIPVAFLCIKSEASHKESKYTFTKVTVLRSVSKDHFELKIKGSLRLELNTQYTSLIDFNCPVDLVLFFFQQSLLSKPNY